jgi:hypothetical protein
MFLPALARNAIRNQNSGLAEWATMTQEAFKYCSYTRRMVKFTCEAWGVPSENG